MIISLVKNQYVNWNLQTSTVEIQLRSRAKTKMSQSVTFLKPWKLFYFHFVKRGKFMILGGGIEIPCQYNIIGPKIHKKYCRKELRKA